MGKFPLVDDRYISMAVYADQKNEVNKGKDGYAAHYNMLVSNNLHKLFDTITNFDSWQTLKSVQLFAVDANLRYYVCSRGTTSSKEYPNKETII